MVSPKGMFATVPEPTEAEVVPALQLITSVKTGVVSGSVHPAFDAVIIVFTQRVRFIFEPALLVAQL